MDSNAITTITRMMETLPETVQNQIVEHLREYITELQDELHWDVAFNNTQEQLIKATQIAKKQIDEGKAEPLDLNQF